MTTTANHAGSLIRAIAAEAKKMKIVEFTFTVTTTADDLTEEQLTALTERIENAFDDVDAYARERIASEAEGINVNVWTDI